MKQIREKLKSLNDKELKALIEGLEKDLRECVGIVLQAARDEKAVRRG